MPIAGAIAVPNGNTYSIVGNTGISSATFPVNAAFLTGGNMNVSTSATGTAYTAFSSQVCSQLTISNDTGTKLDVRQGGAGDPFRVLDSTYYTFFGITDASQISVKRTDNSVTPVTVYARWEK